MRKNSCPYPVDFVDGLFGKSPAFAKALVTATGREKPRMLLVADSNVVYRTPDLGEQIGRYVKKHGITLAGNPVVIGGGEKIKNDDMVSAYKVVSALLDAQLGSHDCVVALGGGSLIDVAGYAAAQVRGGIPIVRAPTTPAAMMCAAFSEYAAVDSEHVKDALRVASEPAAVLIDFHFARTVLDGVWRAGIAEAVRLSLVHDSAFLKRLSALSANYSARDMEALEAVVREALDVRQKKGSTPFALWLAERLEPMSAYRLPHGYATAIAVAIEAYHGVRTGRIRPSVGETVARILTASGSLDGFNHSRHLVADAENVLHGLDAWEAATGSPAIVVPTGAGKSELDENPDRAAYAETLAAFVADMTPADEKADAKAPASGD